MKTRIRCVSSTVALLAALLAPTPALCLPILSEVLYDATGSDDGQVFVEIYGAAGTSLDGYFVDGINGANGDVTVSIALSGAIPSDGFFVLADGVSGVTAVAEADQIANFDFQNGPDSVVLRLAEVVVDALGYGVFDGDPFFAGEGNPAPDAPAGSSLARLFANLDTDDNAVDWIVSGEPSPGHGPLHTVPEPGTAALLALGLLGFGVGRRPVRR